MVKKLLLILPLLAFCLPAQVQLNNAQLSNFQVVGSPPISSTPVDLLFQWTGTQGLLTTNIVVASEIGADKGVVNYIANLTSLEHTILTNESFTSKFLFNIGGVLHSNFPQSVVFDEDIATRFEGVVWTPSEIHSNLTIQGVFSFVTGGTSVNWDLIDIQGGNFSVVEKSDNPGNNYLLAHGDSGGTTKVGSTFNLLNNRNYIINLRHHLPPQLAEVMIVDEATGFLVGSSIAASTITNVAYVNFIEDYLWSSGATGNIRVRYEAFDWSNAAMPIGPDPAVLPVTNLIATQIATNQIDVAWGSPAYSGVAIVYCDFLLERNDGTNWFIVRTNTDTTFSDTVGLVFGATYTYRVTCKAHDFGYLSSVTTTSNPVTITAGCVTLSDSQESSYLQDAGTQIYVAGWIPSSGVSETICRIDAYLSGNNSLDGQWTLEVWSYGSGVPGTLITSSSSVNQSDVPPLASPDWLRFNNLNWSKSSGVEYVFVIHATGANPTAPKWRTAFPGDAGHDTVWNSPDGTTWTSIDIANLDRVWFREYKQ